MPAATPGPPRDVVVLLAAVPTRDRLLHLVEFMKTLPGRNAVEVVVPGNGGEVTLPVGFKCGLTPTHEARVSLILGSSAMVHYTLGSVDYDDLDL